MAAADADLTTEDETQEEQEGRTRCYRIQRALLELTPLVLTSVLKQAWMKKKGITWSPGTSGKELKSMIKREKDFEQRAGKQALQKLAKGEIDTFDITFFALLLVDDPALLPTKSAEAKAIKDLRKLRNELVHNLHSRPVISDQDFAQEWPKIISLLEQLAQYSGSDTRQRLDSEKDKILKQGVDTKKQREFAIEFENMRGQQPLGERFCARVVICAKVVSILHPFAVQDCCVNVNKCVSESTSC
jgi:hypothetical protein